MRSLRPANRRGWPRVPSQNESGARGVHWVLKSGLRAGPWGLKGGLRGKRQEYLRKSLGKAFNSVDNTEVLAENPPDIIVGLSIETDAMAVNPFTFQFAHRLPRIGDEKLGIAYIDVRGLTIGQDEQQALVLFSV